jgi:hypothetical protein
MRTLKGSALLGIFVIGLGMSWIQDVEIKSGGFAVRCKATEEVRSNPDFLALYESVVAGLKSLVESNQIALIKNVDVQAEVRKSSAGKVLNGVMVKAGASDAEPATFKSIFFPCKDPAQSKQDYQEKVYNDYFKMLADRIRGIGK